MTVLSLNGMNALGLNKKANDILEMTETLNSIHISFIDTPYTDGALAKAEGLKIASDYPKSYGFKGTSLYDHGVYYPLLVVYFSTKEKVCGEYNEARTKKVKSIVKRAVELGHIEA